MELRNERKSTLESTLSVEADATCDATARLNLADRRGGPQGRVIRPNEESVDVR